MEGLEKHLTERTMTAEEYLKTWKKFDGSINMGDALEAIRLSKIEALERFLGICNSLSLLSEAENILTSQINDLKNEHTKNDF